MARDITVKVVGKNPDGSLSLQLPDGENPFAGGAMEEQPQQGFQARLPTGQLVTFMNYQDFLAADAAFRRMMNGGQAMPTLGGATEGRPMMGGGTNWLRTGADSADTVAGFLRGRALRETLRDYQDSLDKIDSAAAKLQELSKSKYGDLIPTLLDALQAERDSTESAFTAMEDELTAVDLMTGAGAVRVISDFMGNDGGGSSSGVGTALAVGGAAVAGGLLLSRGRGRGWRRR